jgi:hypothetical protein
MQWLIDNDDVPSLPEECENIPENEFGKVIPGKCLVEGQISGFSVFGFEEGESISIEFFREEDASVTLSQRVDSDGNYNADIQSVLQPGKWRFEFEGAQHRAIIHFVVIDDTCILSLCEQNESRDLEN